MVNDMEFVVGVQCSKGPEESKAVGSDSCKLIVKIAGINHDTHV
jgi:hypothetical protein